MKNLRKARKARHYTQKQLAEEAGCSQEMISLVETGGNMSVKLAKRIGEVLQCEWWTLTEDEERPDER